MAFTPNPFTDPQFAGLHWVIDPDTPDEEREAAHYRAALHAKALRDRPKPDVILVIAEDPCSARLLLRYPNGSRVWTTELELHHRNLRVTYAVDRRPSREQGTGGTPTEARPAGRTDDAPVG